MRVHEIFVSATDWAAARKRRAAGGSSAYCCPLAQAVCRALDVPVGRVAVTPRTVVLYTEAGRHVTPLPSLARPVLSTFDAQSANDDCAAGAPPVLARFWLPAVAEWREIT